jgi:hypothetical protein
MKRPSQTARAATNVRRLHRPGKFSDVNIADLRLGKPTPEEIRQDTPTSLLGLTHTSERLSASCSDFSLKVQADRRRGQVALLECSAWA